MTNVFQLFGIVAFVLALLAPQLSYGQVQIGDIYQGGIVFYVDHSGQKGLICQTRDVGSMDWHDAVYMCDNLGDGWRLPTKDELNLMFENLHQRGRGGFSNDFYWSSSDFGHQTDVWDQDFSDGFQNFDGKEGYNEYVRAVREFTKNVAVSAEVSLQSSIQAGAFGRNRIPISRNDPAYTVEGLDIVPAIYVEVTFSDGSTIGPHDYQKDYADNLIVDDVSGDPNDLIEVSWWDIDSNNPGLGQFAAQLTSTGNGVGEAYLKISLRDAPHITASVMVEVVSTANLSRRSNTPPKVTLAAPKLYSPPNEKVFTHYPRETTLTWGAVAGAKKYIVELDCYYSSSREWATDSSDEPFRLETTSDTFYSFGWVGAQAGRWRITAVDQNGNEGAVSEWRLFEYTR